MRCNATLPYIDYILTLYINWVAPLTNYNIGSDYSLYNKLDFKDGHVVIFFISRHRRALTRSHNEFLNVTSKIPQIFPKFLKCLSKYQNSLENSLKMNCPEPVNLVPRVLILALAKEDPGYEVAKL